MPHSHALRRRHHRVPTLLPKTRPILGAAPPCSLCVFERVFSPFISLLDSHMEIFLFSVANSRGMCV
jgi:hypothetical protein